MSDFVLVRAESVLGWELRGALASGRPVRLALSERCDGVYLNPDGQRILEGRVTRVAATDAYCVVQGRHVPLSDVLGIIKPHYTQTAASDPADPLDSLTPASARDPVRQRSAGPKRGRVGPRVR